MENSPKDIQLDQQAKETFEKVTKVTDIFNILILGKTGVGKSTLINAVFHENLAKTGKGKPVTQQIEAITKPGMPICIYDSKGLELKDFPKIQSELNDFLSERKKEIDISKHIHAAWVCLRQMDSRVESAELDLIFQLVQEGLPVIVVITQAYDDDEGSVEKAVLDGLKERGLDFPSSNIMKVIALEKKLRFGTIPSEGLTELIKLTSKLAPKGLESAIAQVQKVCLDLKIEEAHKIINTAAMAAMAAAASPLPFSDCLVLTPIEGFMIGKIATLFSVHVTHTFIRTFLASFLGTSAATIIGIVVTNLVKLIPLLGGIVSSVISGPAAGALTKLLGEAFLNVMIKLYRQGEGDPPTEEEIAQYLEKEIQEEEEKKKSK